MEEHVNTLIRLKVERQIDDETGCEGPLRLCDPADTIGFIQTAKLSQAINPSLKKQKVIEEAFKDLIKRETSNMEENIYSIRETVCSLRDLYQEFTTAHTLYVYTIVPKEGKREEEEEIVYIGKSKNFPKRHRDGHKASSMLMNPIFDQFDKFVYIFKCTVSGRPVELEYDTKDADSIILIGEQTLINRFQPRLNTDGRDKPRFGKAVSLLPDFDSVLFSMPWKGMVIDVKIPK